MTECKYYKKRNFFEWLMDDFPHCKCPNKESGICVWRKNFRVNCPDYETKEKKDNGLKMNKDIILTEKGKERIRKIYDSYKQSWEDASTESESIRNFCCFMLLRRIFGKELFDNGSN